MNVTSKKGLRLGVWNYDDGVTVGLSRIGPKTIVTLGVEEVTATGVATCNPIDKYSEEVGQSIATARAIKNLGETLEELWVSRAVTKQDWEKKHKRNKDVPKVRQNKGSNGG